MLNINTNPSGLIVQSSLKSSTNGLNTAIERMTTGFKINHAKDNAANFAINTKLSSKISAYNIAEDNTLMGMDMLLTAEDALSQINGGLSRLRSLAVLAQNGTYGNKSLEALNNEVGALAIEINRIFKTARYNGKLLLDKYQFDIPENIGTTVDLTPKYNGFIENPIDYTLKDYKSAYSKLENISGCYQKTSGNNDAAGEGYVYLQNYDMSAMLDEISYMYLPLEETTLRLESILKHLPQLLLIRL